MKVKGIEKGDKNFRHFEFDDEKVITRNGKKYYQVDYGKNPLEGEYGDAEIGYIPCENVMVLGGRRKPAEPVVAKTNDAPVSVPQMQEEPVEKKERKTSSTRTSKTKDSKTINETKKRSQKSNIEVTETLIAPTTPSDVEKFEYYVSEFHSEDIHELQRQLNEMGDEGWEMCGFDTNKSMFGNIHIVCIFKRKRG